MGFDGLHIGLVGPLPPPAGGMANQTRQLGELLQEAGAKVTLVQTNAPYRPAWVARIPLLRALFRLIPYLISLWQMAGQVSVVHVMANSGWSWHLFATPAIWIARLRTVPVVINYRGGEAEEFLEQSQALVRFSMRRVAALIVPSRFLQGVFARFSMSAEVVPNIIDLSRFRPRTSESAAVRHFVVARNLEPLYDNETALRAFGIVAGAYPDARLTIAGSGPEAQNLRDLAAALGQADRVTFSGRLDREQMAELYRQADVMINPSLADNMPNSVLEAMASGVPVVSTNVGGVPFIVEDGVTALLVEPGQAKEMAEALLRLVGDPALCAGLSRAGLAEVERYTWARVAPVLANVYSVAIGKAAH